jgi:hypothetical protein
MLLLAYRVTFGYMQSSTYTRKLIIEVKREIDTACSPLPGYTYVYGNILSLGKISSRDISKTVMCTGAQKMIAE